jgi:hypothetical protein
MGASPACPYRSAKARVCPASRSCGSHGVRSAPLEDGSAETDRSLHQIMNDQKNPPQPGAHAPGPPTPAPDNTQGEGGGHRSTSVARRPRPFNRSGWFRTSAGGSSKPYRSPPSSDRWPCLGTPCTAHRRRVRNRWPSARSSAIERPTGKGPPRPGRPWGPAALLITRGVAAFSPA